MTPTESRAMGRWLQTLEPDEKQRIVQAALRAEDPWTVLTPEQQRAALRTIRRAR